MVCVFNSKQLHALFNYLEKTLTPEDLKNLKELAPRFWEAYPNNFLGKEGKENATTTAHLIQTIVDAKLKQYPRTGKNQNSDRTVLELNYADCMPKKYLLEIAEILGIKGFEDMHKVMDTSDNRFQVATAIMEKIGEPYP
jgi:hypothetical protein